MIDDEFDPDADLDARLSTAISGATPDVAANGVIDDVEWRARRRTRRVRETVAAGLVVLAGGAVAIAVGLSSGPQGTYAGPASTSTSLATPNSTTDRAGATAAQSRGMRVPPPTAPPCKAGQRTPTIATGRFCGPAPHAGNGAGPNGTCTGDETIAPCGPGVVPGRYYNYTMPGSCSGLVTFDGKPWVSELPLSVALPDYFVWMRLGTDGALGWISQDGAVGFMPYVGQALKACSQ